MDNGMVLAQQGIIEVTGNRKVRRGAGALARAGAMAGLGLAGLLFGAFPYLAARRVLYPVTSEPLPTAEPGPLALEVDAEPQLVEFEARDGKRLTGWFIPGPASREAPWPCVLLVYGYGGYKEQMVGYAQLAHAGGYATFLFDMRGSGRRRGEPVSLGYRERWDLLDAAQYLKTRSDVDANRLGVLGVSMGAATALMAAQEDPSIKAIVADSSYADLPSMVRPGLETFVGKPASFMAPLIVLFAETMLGMKAAEVRPEAAAANLGDRPLLIIHGANDRLTNPQSAQRIYDAASGPKELWMVPDCDHACAPSVALDEYRRRVIGFFDTWL